MPSLGNDPTGYLICQYDWYDFSLKWDLQTCDNNWGTLLCIYFSMKKGICNYSKLNAFNELCFCIIIIRREYKRCKLY